MTYMNWLAMGIGYIVLALAGLVLLWLLWEFICGVRHSLDYHRWVIAQAKLIGTYETEIRGKPNYPWRWLKSVASHSWDYMSLVEGNSIQRSQAGGWWQYRGNWVLKNGVKGPRFNPNTPIMN